MLNDLTGLMIGHYQIIRPIEQGGMATVYLAKDIHLQRQVAIKVFQFADDQGRTDEFFQRFTREAQVVAHLDHPNIVLVHDYGEQDSLAYLVMPYFASGSLKQLLQKRGRLSIPEALHFSFQLLNALQYAHDRGLIHRDIKPGNILFKDDQTAVLADFGLVKEMVTGLTGKTGEMTAIGLSATPRSPLTNGALMGTPYYMAPEQIQGMVQSQSDIYSIGLVLYEMLTGRLPFVPGPLDGVMNILLKQTNDPPHLITDLNPNIPTQLGAVIMLSLEKDAARRYQNPRAFAEALRTAARESIPSFAPHTQQLQSDPADQPQQGLDLNATARVTDVKSEPPSSSVGQGSSLPEPALTATYSPLSQKYQHTPHKRRLAWLLYSVLAALLLLTLIFTSPFLLSLVRPSTNKLVAAVKSPTAIPTKQAAIPTKQAAITSPMPGTQTDCPATGTARAAVLAPYAAQGNNVVVYAASTNTEPATGTLMSYNPLTGKTKPIITVPHLLSNVQLSADGQWVIFSTYDNTPGSEALIEMVRIDGKGLQTLYCSSSSLNYLLASPGLSTVQEWSLFFMETSAGNKATMVALNIFTGKIELDVDTSHDYRPITWENDQSLYLLDRNASANSYDPTAQSHIVIVNIDPTQPTIDPTILSQIALPTDCSDLSFGTDYNQLFTSQCTGLGGPDNGASGVVNQGKSTIAKSQYAIDTGKWSTPKNLYSSETQAIIEVRAVTSTKLLFLVSNGDAYQNQNGLWEINTDGTGQQHLYAEKTAITMLNTSSQYPWSNVSRDGNNYAFKIGSSQALGQDQLFFGSLSGGQPTSMAADGVGGIDPEAQLKIVGWTTI